MVDFALTVAGAVLSLGLAHLLTIAAALAAFLVLPRPPVVGAALGIVAGLALTTALDGNAPPGLPLVLARVGASVGFAVRW